ncbi:hypothetical protein [Bradyrhizobium elkanii]|uniref:hypothetical protein n=1 Tax=Bradyrhizobium elkanii TaxID=29448 RepID=UPI000841AD10|nr:hypothetical protein [Bradyrhizobium elkanii]ODM76728.1 hypothetical protein A6X20_29180 [Bradyrhizobium elkanii]ODM80807.1 hypothetical protein A6452_23725 [Bradyrhizobium elkanii]
MQKSLKEQNNWKIWLVVAFNVLFFWGYAKANAIRSDQMLSGWISNVATLLPAGLAGIVATVLNSLISADMKARIVFWRWHHALPGNRAFSLYAPRDPRVNMGKLKSQLKTLPIEPDEQNATWYKIYKSVEKQPSINDAHKTFLFLRDYATLSLLFLVIFGAMGGPLVITDWQVSGANAGILLCQFLIVCLAARNAGIRMVTNVLAIKTAGAR